MSRSFRQPYWTDGYGGKWRKFVKRLAAKKVRRTKFVGKGAAYKRIYDSWLICDFSFPENPESDKFWKAKRK